MTLAELRRWLNSRARVIRAENQKRATFDYIHARLVAKGVAIAFGDKSEFPELKQTYHGLFVDAEEIAEQEQREAEAKAQLSMLRFKQFANFHNKKYEEVASEK